MIELFGLVMRLAGEVHAELFENAGIDLREHDGGMDLAAGKLGKLRERELRDRVGRRRNGQRNQHFVGVQTGVVVAETLDLELLDRLDAYALFTVCMLIPAILASCRTEGRVSPS